MSTPEILIGRSEDPIRERLLGLFLTALPTGALLYFYWQPLNRIARLQWFREGSQSICALVPIISLAILFAKRERLRAIPVKPVAWGILLTAIALIPVIFTPVIGEYDGVIAVAMAPMAIGGMILAIRGTETLRAVLFPVLFLLLMKPVPQSPSIDVPLQMASAQISASVLNVVGLHVTRQGTLLMVDNDNAIAVAPECDGVRSATALLILGVLYAYLLAGSWRRRLLLVAVAVPYAYVGNIARISGEVVAMHRFQQWVTAHFTTFDSYFGLVAFFIPMALLYGTAGVLGCRQFREIG